MGLFRQRGAEPTGEKLPEFLPASCLGDKCPNFSGTACEDTETEWMGADCLPEGRDESKPPLKDKAKFITYGQTCFAGVAPELVAQRVEVYMPDEVDMGMLVAQTGRYGDMPIEFVYPDAAAHIETIASSDDL